MNASDVKFSWLDIVKYDEFIESIDDHELVEELRLRLVASSYMKWKIDNPNKSLIIGSGYHKCCKAYSYHLNRLMNGEQYGISDFNYESEAYDCTPVRKVDAVEIYLEAIHARIDGLSFFEYNKMVECKNPKYVDSYGSLISFDDASNIIDGDILLRINLDAKDETLLDALKNILTKTRQERDKFVKKHISNAEVQKIKKLRLLAYMDLIIFMFSENIKLSHVVMANILYPDEYEINTVDRVKKTMPVLTKELGDWIAASTLKLIVDEM